MTTRIRCTRSKNTSILSINATCVFGSVETSIGVNVPALYTNRVLMTGVVGGIVSVANLGLDVETFDSSL